MTPAELLSEMFRAWVADVESVEFPHFTYPEGPR